MALKKRLLIARAPRHPQQEQQVEHLQEVVGAADVVEHRVVIGPDHAHLQEAEHVGHVHWPLVVQRLGERNPLQRVHAGDLEVEHEQGQDDGEDPIAQCFEPRGVGFSSGTAPGIASTSDAGTGARPAGGMANPVSAKRDPEQD
jgi:hypothetical protein